MKSIHFFYFIVLVIVSQNVESLSLSQRSSSEWNITLVDHCYFDRWWKTGRSSWCPAVISGNNSGYDDGKMPKISHRFLEPLHQIYLDYVANQPQDRQKVYNCFVVNFHQLDQQSQLECSQLVMSNISLVARKNFTTRRELKAQEYFRNLTEWRHQIISCKVHITMLPHQRDTPKDCEQFSLDFVTLMDCFRYHQYFTQYEKCRGISWDQSTNQPPESVRSLYLRLAYKHMQKTFQVSLKRLQLVKPDEAQIFECLYTNSWLSIPDHLCWDIVQPMDQPSQYSARVQMLQERFIERRKADVIRDCNTNHKGEPRVMACYGITWQ